MLSRLFTVQNLLIVSFATACLAFFVFFITPTGTADVEAEKVTRIYFADNITSAHRQVIARFNEKHHDRIQVVPINLPFAKFSTNERKQLLTRSFRSKNTRIDVFAVDLVWAPRFVKWVEPLSPYFSPQERGNFLSYALQSCYSDSVLVGVPFYIDIGMMYYRADLLSKLPGHLELEEKLRSSITWEEFIRLGQRPELAGHPFYLFPADNFEGLVCCFVEAVNSQRASLIKNDSLCLNTPETRRALQLLTDLVNRYRLTPGTVTEYTEVDIYRYALDHDAVFFRGWPGNLRGYPADREKVEKIRIAALPHFQEARAASVYGGWNLMISKDSEKKEAALRFLQFATSPEAQKILYEEMGYLPANKKVYEDTTFFASRPELQYLRQLLDHGVHRPALVEYTKISDILSFYCKKAIKMEMPVEQALQSAQNMIRSEKVLIN
jgi:multiple sugar transport system substrate-binding protein